MSLFYDWDLTSAGNNTYLSILSNNLNKFLDVRQQIVPPLAFALKYFGGELPESLVHKLKNKPQTLDTLFELTCLGIFMEHHNVVYEPILADGRKPDLLLKLNGGPPMYVECKSHHFQDAPYWESFFSVSADIHKMITNEPIVAESMNGDLRLEVHLNARPTNDEIEIFRNKLSNLTLKEVRVDMPITPNITITAAPKTQALRYGSSMWNCFQSIGTKPQKLSVNNDYAIVYAWPGLERQRRKLQRAILKDARLQLRGIPAGSLGMICIETVSATPFLPDLHKLIDQDEFSQIPIICLNPTILPGVKTKIVFRNGTEDIVRKVFS